MTVLTEAMRVPRELGNRLARHRRLNSVFQSAGLIVLAWALLRLFLHNNPAPMGTLVYGGILGVLYALVAFGLILVYRASRIINFAQAEMGAAAGVLGALLIKVTHVPYLLALPLTLAAGVVSGIVVEVGVVRWFRKAPRLALSVATIGVALVFAALQLFLPYWFGVLGVTKSSDARGASVHLDQRPPTTPFSHIHFRIDYTVFNANFIVIIVAGLAMLALLGAFLKFADVGLAVRAAAENADRATLLGIPINRVSVIVWGLAGGLSALGMFLRIPITGLPIGVFVGPSVLLAALAAAVIARMERFGVALGAGIALGMVEQAVYFSTHDADVPVAVLLPILLAAMLVQRQRISRGEDTGVATWTLSREFRLIPPELRALPEIVGGRVVTAAAVVALLALLPFAVGLTQEILFTVMLCYGIVCVSLVILTGWSGQISLGQWGFGGVGAAVAGGMASHLHANFFLCLLAAGLMGAAVALAIGLPALRIQGLYLAVTTLALALAVEVFLLNPSYFSWLLPSENNIDRPVLFARFDLSNQHTYYFVVLFFLALALASAAALRRSRAGRLLLAVRDNPRGAQAYSVSVRSVKLWAFAISGFWAAIGGALFAFQEGALDNVAFAPDLSITLLLIVVIGGSSTLLGAMLGTAYYAVMQYGGFSVKFQFLASGIGALVLLMVLRGGLAQLVFGLRDVLLRYVANRRGIVVPSLLADVRQEAGAAPPDEHLGATLAAQALDADAEPLLRCPQCAEQIPVSQAPDHEHFASAAAVTA